MSKRLLFILAFGFSAGLLAYGVSPNQYRAGQAQDANAAGLPTAPQPMPLPGSAMAPGYNPLMSQGAPPPTVDYEAVAVPAWAKGWKHYDWSQALALWKDKDALFCDARSKPEYDQGHIPGAIPLPLNQFDKYYALYKQRILRAKHIVTYCHGANCQLSNKVAQKLVEEKKLKDVGAFFGGWPQWQEHHMPIQSGGTPRPR